MSGVNCILIFLFFPETQYFRPSTSDPLQVLDPSSFIEKDSASQQVLESGQPTQEISNIALPQKKSFLEELKPWSGINPGIEKNTAFLFILVRPWTMVVYPGVIYAFLVFAVTLACVIGVVGTSASVFQSPPYNMSPGIQGLGQNVPLAVGVFLGSYSGGGLTDRYLEWRSRKNNGIHEPETRLVTVILPFFIVPAGVLMCFAPAPE